MTSTRSDRRRGRVGLATSCLIFLQVAAFLFALSSSCGFLIVIAAAEEMTGGILRGQNTGDAAATAGRPDHRILKGKPQPTNPSPTAAPVAAPVAGPTPPPVAVCGECADVPASGEPTSCSTPGETTSECGVVDTTTTTTCSKAPFEVCNGKGDCSAKGSKCNQITQTAVHGMCNFVACADAPTKTPTGSPSATLSTSPSGKLL